MIKTKQPKDVDRLLRAAGQGRLDLVQELIAKGMSVNTANNVGGTSLMAACASYRVEMIKFLLQNGVNIKMKTTDGRTALHAAVGSTPSLPEMQQTCVRILLEHGAEMDARDHSGISPLMNAAWFGCTLAVQELLSHGASTSLRDSQGRSAEDLAKAKKRQEVLNLFGTKP